MTGLRSYQRGYLLLPVAVAIALIGVIAYVIASQSAINVNMASSEFEAARADYVAQAGMHHGLRAAEQQACGPYTNLTDVAFSNDKYSTTLTTGLGGTAPHTISVDQDGWIRNDQPSKINATDTRLHLRYEGGNIERPVIRFDVSAIPAQSTLLSATAWFFVNSVHPEGPLEIRPITRSWTEADANWDLLGDAMGDEVLGAIAAQPTWGAWVPVNLTAQVQAWVNGYPNFGITLYSQSEGVNGEYSSSESGNAPYIDVIVGVPPSSPAMLESVGTLDNGVSRTLLRNDLVLYQQPPGMLQLQPDAADGEDAEIWDQQPDNNYGAAAETWVSSASNDTTRSLLRFDLGAIPAGARILSADLFLERQSGSGADQPVSAHRIMNPWNENSVTWNRRRTGTNWDTAGGDFDNTAVATTPVGPANQRYAWNIMPLVQGWVDGSYPNHGVVLVAAIAGMTGHRFYTSDAADPSTWPSLSITYVCACGTVCVAPGGSGKIAMVVNYQGFSISPADQQKKDIIESWGYDVDAHDDNFLWLLNTDNYDVVYISETADSGAVGTQLTAKQIGIVSEEGELNDELELAGGSAATTGAAIDIVDNSHYISAPFASGALSIYTADMELLTASGAGGLQTLAKADGNDSLVLLDQGGLLTGGGIAAGRRVVLPLGGATSSNFDWNYLNANGRLLVQRAIAWGAGTDGICSAGDYRDEFASTDYDGSVGSLDWAPNPWQELGESDGTNQGRVRVNSSSDCAAGNCLRIGGDDVNIDSRGASRAFDLSNALSARLEFVYRRSMLDGAGGRVVLAISTDGGGAWSDLAAYDLNATDSDQVAVSLDIGAYTGEDVHIRFLGSGTAFSYFRVDDIQITRSCSPPPPPKKVYWTDDIAGVIQRSDEDGSNVETVIAGQFPVRGLDIDTVGGKIYWTNGTRVRRSDLDGGNVETLIDNLLVSLLDVKLDVAAGKMYWTSESTLSDFRRADLDGNNDEIFNIALDEPLYFSLDTNAGHIYHTDYDTGDVSRSNLDGSSLVNLVAGGGTAMGNAIDLAGGKMYWSSGAAGDWIQRADLDGSSVETIVTGLAAPQDIVFDGDNERIYWADGLGPSIKRADADGSNVETIVTGLLRPRGIVIVDASLVPPTPKLGPIAHWKLDETGGTTAVDSEGGHDGNVSGAGWTNGHVDGALDFNGSSDYVDLTADVELDDVFDGGATVMAWINADTWGESDHGRILDKASQTSGAMDGWNLALNGDDGALEFSQGFSTLGGYWRTPSASLSLGGWMHVAVVYNSNSDENEPTIFLNGIPQGSLIGFSPLGTMRSDGGIALRMGNHAMSTTRSFDGKIDDVRIYERMLGAGEIQDVYIATNPPSQGYNEMSQEWSASSNDTWETVDLGSFGVPANAVVEVAIENSQASAEHEAGLRATGSTIDRIFDLHEAESGGVDALVLQVQADASSQIQHYTDSSGFVTFRLLGYWVGAAYTELERLFNAAEDGGWRTHNLAPYGVSPGQIVEIVVQNTNASNERTAGVRKTGSGNARIVDLHESESGGEEFFSVFVEASADASASVQLHAEHKEDIEFNLVGVWSTPPGSYTEAAVSLGSASADSTWQNLDLSAHGVPANAVVQITMANRHSGTENFSGLRANGSSLGRWIELHEPEAGGEDLVTLHVTTDAGAQIQWYHEDFSDPHDFYLMGWWVLSP